MIFMMAFGFYRAAKRMEQKTYGGLSFPKWGSVGWLILLIACFIEDPENKNLVVPLIIFAVLFISSIILEKFLNARELKKRKVMEYNKNIDNWK